MLPQVVINFSLPSRPSSRTCSLLRPRIVAAASMSIQAGRFAVPCSTDTAVTATAPSTPDSAVRSRTSEVVNDDSMKKFSSPISVLLIPSSDGQRIAYTNRSRSVLGSYAPFRGEFTDWRCAVQALDTQVTLPSSCSFPPRVPKLNPATFTGPKPRNVPRNGPPNRTTVSKSAPPTAATGPL